MNVQNKVFQKKNFSENNYNISVSGDDLRTRMQNNLGLNAGACVESRNLQPRSSWPAGCTQFSCLNFPKKECIFCIFQAINCICSFQIGTKK